MIISFFLFVVNTSSFSGLHHLQDVEISLVALLREPPPITDNKKTAWDYLRSSIELRGKIDDCLLFVEMLGVEPRSRAGYVYGLHAYPLLVPVTNKAAN